MWMMRPRLLFTVALMAIQAMAAVGAASASTMAPGSPVASPAIDCPVTEPNGALLPSGEVDPKGYGNDALSTSLWSDGEVVFEPGGAGFVLPDGSLGMKWGWVPYIPGELTITGRRLDADAPPLRASIGEGWIGDKMFFPSYIVFSTPGCWEVTGEIDGHRLTFVTLVIQRGEGPDWRPESIP